MASFSDDFNRANSASLGANWTEAAGDMSINTNRLRFETHTYAEMVAAYTGTACASVDQYVKATLYGTGTSGANVHYPSMVFRYTNASSPMYKVFFWMSEDSVTFTRGATASDGSFETVGTASLAIASGDTFGVTCAGSGTDVVVRVWKNPTGNAPDAADSWGGDNTPDVTFTDNPTTPVDSGNYVGLGGESGTSTNSPGWDNFFGGDIPATVAKSLLVRKHTAQRVAVLNHF